MNTWLITGASGGIGLALSKHLIMHGRKVVLQYRSNGEALREMIESGVTYEDFDKITFKADLTDESQIAAMHSHIREHFGPVWGIVNLAGASSNGMSWKLSKEEFSNIINNNLLTTFSVCKEFIPEMREQNGGRIINVSSVAAFAGAAGASHYAAAKAGIVGFTKSLALELAPKNITANVLGLGYFDHGMIDQVPPAMQEQVKERTPLKRFGMAPEIADAISFLMNEEGGAFTTGQVIHINGGIYL